MCVFKTLPECKVSFSSGNRTSSALGLAEANIEIGVVIDEVRGRLGNSGFTKGFFRLKLALRTRCLNFSRFLER